MYENKRFFILGMAKSGYAAAKFLIKKNQTVFITDCKEQNKLEVEELQKLGVTYQVTDTPDQFLDESYDVLIKNPGIHMDHPCLLKAKKLGIPIINEVELAYHYLPQNITIIGVTGSNGKTTTVTLIYEIMKQAKLPVHLAGNIGYPLCQIIEEIKVGDILLMEISDHQLLDMYDFKTNISVLTNLSPTHLDLHGTYEHYIEIKKRIFHHHTSQDIAIINQSNSDSVTLTKDLLSTKYTFGYHSNCDIYLKDNVIYQNQNKIIDGKNTYIKGKHNYENIMAAILVVQQFDVSNNVIQQVLETFEGVEHRIEYVRTWKNIDFYNDSKSTNPKSTMIAIDSFEKPIVLILGGYDRYEDFSILQLKKNKIKAIIAYGASQNKIAAFANINQIPYTKVTNIQECVPAAITYAKPNDVVLLSPGCASWDQYAHFEERGNEFKKYINEL